MANSTKSVPQLIKHFRTREFLSLTSNRSTNSAINAPNPFLPTLNTATGRWVPPRYSLRRQAQLVRSAKDSGTLSLLPSGPKNPNITVHRYKVHEKADTSSPIIKLLLNPKLSSPPINSTGSSLNQLGEALRNKYPVQWTGEPKIQESYGLYGKRKAMFKGHKWEKEVLIRRKLTAHVLDNLETAKRNMAWGRKRKSKRPTKKVPW
ncbi:54S ribosomal protein L25, mitochondrial [Tulasnella sp. 419]|nr:54S ribosomal protein L25, mitochondrial [Tulasnella sp. 419]